MEPSFNLRAGGCLGDAPGTRDLCAIRGKTPVAHVEFNSARQFDDGFGMVAVLGQRVFDGLGAVDEEAAIEPVLFLRHPLATSVPADEDDVRERAARRRFGEFHFLVSFADEGAASLRMIM